MVQFFDPTQEVEIKRRRRMAEELQKQGQARPTEVVGGYAVPQSGFEGLARGLAGFAGGYQGAQADTQEKDLVKQRQALLTEALSTLDTDPKAAAKKLMQDPSMLATGLGLYTDATKTDRAQILADAKAREARITAGIRGGALGVDADGNPIAPEDGWKPKPKLSATQQKELFDTIDMVNAGQSSLKNLEEADLIRKGGVTGDEVKPYSGWGAETLTSLEGVPILGMLANKDRAAKTADYTNLVKTQALSGLKALVGSNPTEGERKIILDLQALASFPEDQQAAILENAKKAAQSRIEFNQRKATMIESGDFSGLANIGAESPVMPSEPQGTAPQGGKVIGTSGGKKVYQLPDGSHVIEE